MKVAIGNVIKAKMLNRKASLSKFKANEVIKALNIPKGAFIADIGAGGGYFTFLFAEEVGPGGQVFAADINKGFLAFINNHAEKNGISNVTTVLIKENSVNLEEKCDIIFLRNVFHHIEDPVSYFKNLKCLLKPNGRVVIIDYKPKKRSGLSFLKWHQHYVEEEFILESMKNAEYSLIKRHSFLTDQIFSEFQCKIVTIK